jgi:hypothetical protein
LLDRQPVGRLKKRIENIPTSQNNPATQNDPITKNIPVTKNNLTKTGPRIIPVILILVYSLLVNIPKFITINKSVLDYKLRGKYS